MTKIQRATAIAEALLNRTPTQAEVARMVSAFCDLPEEAAGTPAEKLDTFLSKIRYLVLEQIKSTEAEASVVTARASARASVDMDFAETN